MAFKRFAAVGLSWLALSAFGADGGLGKSKTYTLTADAIDTLISSMSDESWQRLDDKVSQTGGISDVTPTVNLTSFAVVGEEDDFDLGPVGDDNGTGTDAEVQAWCTDDARSVLRAWNTGVVVDKAGDVRFYIPGAGGHANYCGNEVYSFDILAAAISVNASGNGAVWVRENDPAKIRFARDPGTASILRDFTNYPYGAILDDYTTQDFVPHVGAAASTDQRNAGPLSNHLYGGLLYDVELDALVVYGGSNFRGGTDTPGGFWLWDLTNDEWTLLPDDYALGAGAAAVDGVFDLKGATASWNTDLVLVKVGDPLRFVMAGRGFSARIRLDGGTYTTNYGGHNTNAQKTGNWSAPPSVNAQAGGNGPVAAPWNKASPPGTTSNNTAVFVFYEDASAGGNDGYATVWPDVDQDESTDNTATYLSYNNAVPNAGGNQLPDLTSGYYSAEHDAFLFLHRVWLSDFNGQIYKLTRTSPHTWSTLVDPTASTGPQQVANPGLDDNGVRGMFTCIRQTQACFVAYDSVGEGQAWIAKVPAP